MKAFRVFLALLPVVVLLAMGCDRPRGESGYSYRVSVSLADSLRCDSVTLHIVDTTYHRQFTTVALRHGREALTFTGQTVGERVAFLTFDTVSTPLYFVLEPCAITIGVTGKGCHVSGGRGNARYVELVERRRALMWARKRILANYRRAATDTTLTLRGERAACVSDSLLSASLQRLLLQSMRGGDAVACIMRQRYIGSLSPASLRQLEGTDTTARRSAQ